jgi:ATP-dependent DNA helicase RecQ
VAGAQGIDALPYHAGMDADARRAPGRFLREDGVVMVATIAFGMGIDKPDVRFVAHLDLPKSDRGLLPGDRPRRPRRRAGRRVDGLRPGRRGAAARMIDESEASEEFKRVERRKLDALLGCARPPAAGACAARLLRRGEHGPAATATTASRRRRPGTPPTPRSKALSCVYRTGQRFGAAHLIDVLRGFHDATLRQIALVEPSDLDALATISGVGATKLERYGTAVLEALSAHA